MLFQGVRCEVEVMRKWSEVCSGVTNVLSVSSSVCVYEVQSVT